MTRHIIQTSGGMGSWFLAELVAHRYGTANMVLLFADTLAEDADLHRFLADSATLLGLPVTRVCDGRTPDQVFADERFIGNNRVAPCTKQLKQIPCRKWLDTHADPDDTVLYVGIGAWEARRIPAIRAGWQPWATVFLAEVAPQITDPDDLFPYAWEIGLRTPDLYEDGFEHNNCQGACVRAGHESWLRLLRTNPDLYALKEQQEQAHRERLGKDVAHLRCRRGGTSRPLTLTELRHRHEREHTAQPAAQTTSARGHQGALFDLADTADRRGEISR